MIRLCPNCNTERPLTEIFCEGTVPCALVPRESVSVDVFGHALNFSVGERRAKDRLGLWSRRERRSFSECAVYVGESMGCSAGSLAPVLRCQRLLQVDLGGFLAAKDTRNGGLKLLRHLALNTPSSCGVLNQIGH
jgi:hypothetical protein